MSKDIIKQADTVIANTYQRIPIVIARGEGCTLWDTEGRQYLDFVAGIAVCNLGHANPKIAAAVAEQAKTLLHVSNLYYTMPQVVLASLLTENSFADRVFFCNSGAEANEAAIKLARKYAYEKGQSDRFHIIAMTRSFHGRTMATLSATGQDKIKKGFSPVLEGFDFVPFNDIEVLRGKISENTCAVLLEPIQGEGGVRCPSPGYLRAVRELCDETGTLLIFDEIQTGMGRTGTLFAYEQFGVTPDIMTLAKALANGFPMGAMLARESVAQAFGPGAHASTFGGTPVVAAAAVEVVKAMTDKSFMAECMATGEYFKAQLLALKAKHPIVADVRGRGLLLGMELKTEGAPFVKACMERGFLINCVQEKTLRFIPPLIVSKAQVDALIHCLDELFGASNE
ncbi:MAG: acetylornithine transaminase [Desulfobacterales bacterium]|jgi:acetylornithine aminotransferase|nr:acetylornithine transaminase [Desulfobacterales bacterium]